jgi:UDP-N-acetylmuramyl tripeptide synthase
MLRTSLAIGASKLTASLTAWLRLGAGTSLPGKVARTIDPQLLHALGSQIREKTLAVTGTNGKTTTCGLLAQFIQEAGKSVVHNHLGANMIAGITMAIVRQSNLLGQLNADYGVLEVDEASLRGVAAEVTPDLVMVTNLFRDQLDRYGELDTTAKMILAGIPTGCPHVVLNADDPLVTALSLGLKEKQTAEPVYYGVERVVYPNPLTVEPAILENVGFPREVTDCPACSGSLVYDTTLFGHLGHYRCSSCDYARPIPTVRATEVVVTPAGSDVTLHIGDSPESLHLHVPLPGLFNVYNVLAACAAVVALGLPSSVFKPGLEQFHGVFGRAERRTLRGKPVWVMLIKNPVGASEVLKLVGNDPNGRLLIALNANYADGRDVSWIWDAMFEGLAGGAAAQKTVVVSGERAQDMAVRLKYAGIEADRLLVEPDLKAAVERALEETGAGETLYVLPTYTALLTLRNILDDLS